MRRTSRNRFVRVGRVVIGVHVSHTAYKAQVVLIEKENKQTIWVRMVFGMQKNEAKGKEHYHCQPKSEPAPSQTLPNEKTLHTQAQRNHAG